MRFPVSSKMLIEYGESSSPLPPTFCCCCCLAFLNFSACLPHITALGASELPPPLNSASLFTKISGLSVQFVPKAYAVRFCCLSCSPAMR